MIKIDINELDPAGEIPIAGDGVHLRWLGQAGFDVRSGTSRILIDPYLSDSLAAKYKGNQFPHKRMMAPPLDLKNIGEVDWVLCSHAHSDHMDPGSLPALAADRSCRFVVPRAELGTAIERGVPTERVLGVVAGESLGLGHGISLTVVPSAHEKREQDADGNDRYIGFVIKSGGLTIYHSGDCVPFDTLAETLRPFHIDVALLPVNGRDEYRTSRGILGNFTFDEATALCHESGIPALIVHHFGMFDFNTVDRQVLESLADRQQAVERVIVPDVSLWYRVSRISR